MNNTINNLFINAINGKEKTTQIRLVMTRQNDTNIYITAPYTEQVKNDLIDDYTKSNFKIEKILTGTTKFDSNQKFNNNFKITCETMTEQQQAINNL